MLMRKTFTIKYMVFVLIFVLFCNISVSAQTIDIEKYTVVETTEEKTTSTEEITSQESGVSESVVETTTEKITDPAFEDLQNQYEKLEQEKKENEEKLNQVNGEIDNQKTVVNDIYDEIDATQTQIDLLTSRVGLLNVSIDNTTAQIDVVTQQLSSLSDKIAVTQAAIDEKNLVLSETYELLRLRVRAMYMAGNGSMLEFLLTSESFSVLLMRAELVVRAAKFDNDLIKMCEQDVAELEALKATLTDSSTTQENKKAELDQKQTSLENQKADIQTTNDMLDKKQDEIKAQYDEAKKQLNQLDQSSQEYKDLINKQEDQLLALSNEMEEYIKKYGSSSLDTDTQPDTNESVSEKNEDTTGENGSAEEPTTEAPPEEVKPHPLDNLMFPLKHKGVYISSPYGMRTHPVTGVYKLHTGVDFTGAGIRQQPIYASEEGRVIYAGAKGAYGNFIIIDHGKGVSTCYAHCDSISVKVNDVVLRGQPIGRVGTTGSSTGDHLHYEIRIDGATTNPMQYISLPK